MSDGGMPPGDRIDLILAITSSLQDRNWYEIDLILREFGFPTEPWEDDDLGPYLHGMLHRGGDDNLAELQRYLGGAVLERPISAEIQRRIWSEGFHLFLSHTATHADHVVLVRDALSDLGISGFIAHADIEPSREWEDEIESALNSCEALAAFIHEDFHASLWTDQEIGHALGRGLPVIPLMQDPQLPYGFLNKFQAIRVTDLTADEIAVQILDTLVSNERTQSSMAPHLVAQFERVLSSERGLSFLKRIAKIQPLSADLLKRLDDAPQSNTHIATDQVRSDLDAILERHDYRRPVPVPSYDEFGEEPF